MRKPLTPEQRARKAATNKAWRVANKEHKAASDKAWYVSNRERRAASDKAWYASNKERKAATNRSSMWKRKYNMSPEDVLALLHKQSCACRICRTPLDFNCYDQKSRTIMQIDHCHETGKVRSILCRNCNTSIGVVEKLSPAAWDYLAHHDLINGLFDDHEDTVDPFIAV